MLLQVHTKGRPTREGARTLPPFPTGPVAELWPPGSLWVSTYENRPPTPRWGWDIFPRSHEAPCPRVWEGKLHSHPEEAGSPSWPASPHPPKPIWKPHPAPPPLPAQPPPAGQGSWAPSHSVALGTLFPALLILSLSPLLAQIVLPGRLFTHLAAWPSPAGPQRLQASAQRSPSPRLLCATGTWAP